MESRGKRMKAADAPFHSESISIEKKIINIEDILQREQQEEGRESIIDECADLSYRLSHNKITSKGASLLFQVLTKSDCKLSVIYMGDNKLDDECLFYLGEYIQRNEAFEGIHLENNQITDKGIEILSPFVIGNKALRCIDLSMCGNITDVSNNCLLKIIETTYIDDLLINGTSIKQQNVFINSLAQNILRCKRDRIYFPRMCVSDENIRSICDGILKYGCDNVSIITLDGGKLTSSALSQLFDSLKNFNAPLISLYLQDDQLDDTCMSIIGEYIASKESLKHIFMGQNRITDKGVEILSESIAGNTSLIAIGLDGNKSITDQGFPFLAIISKSTYVKRIAVHNTLVSKEKRQDLQQLLKTGKDSREIPIRSTSKSAAKLA